MIQMVFCLAAVSVTFGLFKRKTQYLGPQLTALNIERWKLLIERYWTGIM